MEDGEFVWIRVRVQEGAFSQDLLVDCACVCLRGGEVNSSLTPLFAVLSKEVRFEDDTDTVEFIYMII